MKFRCLFLALGCVVGSILAAAERTAKPSAAFIIDAGTAAGLRELFRPTGGVLPVLSAHRGGAGPGYPENCLATFEATVRATWSLLEVDLQTSKDGVIVLMHDATLDRTSNGTGPVKERTLAELRELRLKDRQGALTAHRIPTLDEAIEWARGRTVLVLDKKNVPAKEAARIVTARKAEAFVMVMAYSARDIADVHATNPDIMMEVMMGTPQRLEEFDRTGVPWANAIAFVGHTATPDAELCRRIRAKGAACMAGTSRNVDRAFLTGKVPTVEPLRPEYRAVLAGGVDVIETDIPREIGPLLFGGTPVPPGKSKFLRRSGG